MQNGSGWLLPWSAKLYKQTSSNILSSSNKVTYILVSYYKIWTYFHVLDLKRKTFAEFFVRKVSNFYLKQNKQLFYYETTAFYIYLKAHQHLSGVIFQNSSEWFLQKLPQQTKTCSKVTAKKVLELLQLMLFECLCN